MAPFVGFALALGLGFWAWGLVEYGIHGVLGHRFRTFVTPLHGAHHADPRAVFTSPLAAVPSACVLFGLLWVAAGPALAGAFTLGLIAGFVRYERVHWRIHFRTPRSARERRLRDHHLAHHYRNPRAYYGVTTHRFDRWFGSLPETWERDYESGPRHVPLTGPSNLAAVWNPRSAWAIWRRSRHATS